MSNKVKGSILVLLGACSFGVLSTIVKVAYSHGFTLGEVTGAQTFIGMTFLWFMYILSKIFGKKDNKHESMLKSISHLKSCFGLIGAGIFTGLVGITYYKCVSLIPASIAIILLMQNVWMSMLIESLVFKKKPTKYQIIAMIIVLIGTILAAGVFESRIKLDSRGIVYGLLAALSYSIFIITSGRVGTDLKVIKKSALMITGSCLVTFILFPPTAIFWSKLIAVDWVNSINVTTISSSLLPWGLALALFGTIIPPFLFSKGVPNTGVALGSILGSAELPVAVIASSFILAEHVSYIQILGIIFILLAIVISNKGR